MKLKNKFIPVSVLLIVVLAFLVYFVNFSRKFEPPRQESQSIEYAIRKNTSLEAVINDLKYYDFIKDEWAFTFALEHTQDNKHEGENVIKVGKGSKTINRESVYTISQSMNAWKLASVLLNEGTRQDCDHGCPESNFQPELLPGGDLAPTLKEKYEWVKTYEQCIEAKGQLSSEQYAQKTGIRRCVSPDGREFTHGKEGWTDALGG